MGYIKDASGLYLETTAKPYDPKAYGAVQNNVLGAVPTGGTSIPIGGVVDGKKRNAGGFLEAYIPSMAEVDANRKANPMPTPDPKNPTGATSLSDRYNQPAGNVSPMNPIDKAKADLAEQLGQNLVPKTEQQIMAELTANRQAQIDSIDKYYNEMNAKDTKEGLVREDQTRSFNVRSGNMGSDFATAATAETRGANQKVIDANNAERNLQLAAIYGKISEDARTEAKLGVEKARANAGDRIKILEELSLSGMKQITDAAKRGLAYDSLKSTKLETGESVLEYIKRVTGKGDQEIEAVYNASLPANEKIEYKDSPKAHKGANGNAVIFQYGQNSVGTQKTREVDTGIKYEEWEGKNYELKESNGVFFQFDPQTGTGKKIGFAPIQKAPAEPKNTFNPTASEKSAVNRYISANSGKFSVEDQKLINSDPNAFYAALQDAVNASKDEAFNINPFAGTPQVIISN